MSSTITTLVLRVIVNYHGHMGIHLHPESLKSWNFFRLLWNVTLNISLYYCMYFFDPYTAKGYTVDHRKPLHLLLYFDVFILFPVAYLLCLLYYHFTGRRIVSELNDDLLATPLLESSNKVTSYSIVLLLFFFLLINLNFYLTHDFVLQQHFQNMITSSPLSSFFNLVTVYVIYINWYFVLFLVHYYKTATYLALKSISKRILQTKKCSSEDESSKSIQFRQAVEQIRLLAATNRRLNSLLSFPLFTFLLIFTIDGVANISLSEFVRTFESYLHILVMLLYIAYIAYLSSRTHSKLQFIACQCRNAFAGEENQNEDMDREQKSLQIHLQEIDLYFDSFQLNVFQMFTVNYAFLSTTVLVSFGYCVFIIQTSR